MTYQYYYWTNLCTAQTASDASCICWHDEGTGPHPNERHDSDVPIVEWREKPAQEKPHA